MSSRCSSTPPTLTGSSHLAHHALPEQRLSGISETCPSVANSRPRNACSSVASESARCISGNSVLWSNARPLRHSCPGTVLCIARMTDPGRLPAKNSCSAKTGFQPSGGSNRALAEADALIISARIAVSVTWKHLSIILSRRSRWMRPNVSDLRSQVVRGLFWAFFICDAKQLFCDNVPSGFG